MSDKNIWLLSAYRADSHSSWADWLDKNIKGVRWHRLELPGRHFRWRIRGNPLSWLDSLPREKPDLILATSMVDLATLKGLHPALAGVPSIYYFHENQFAYPTGDRQIRSIEPQMVQLYGALSASQLLFNSQYNLTSFLEGVDDLLDKMPDAVPQHVSQRLRAKAQVLPVAIEPIPAGTKEPGLIVWNHRWEYDKAPELFAAAMLELDIRGIDFHLALLGSRPEQTPSALQQIRSRLAHRIVIDEKADTETYRNILSKASIVVSTSLHEFQGLSVLEAVSAGAVPLLPDDLCYREQYPDIYLYSAGDVEKLAGRLAIWLGKGIPDTTDVSAYHSDALLHCWQKALQDNISVSPCPVFAASENR